ncbi:MAG: Gfo/Idh/MocA family protein [Acidobacteriota bacterium]
MPNKKEPQKSSRREFLGKTAAAVASAPLISGASAAASSAPRARVTGGILGANERINVGFIGCGMQFQSLIRRFNERKENTKDIEYAAVCDVWEPRLKHAQEQTQAPKTYGDYREVLQRPDIDGVVVVVPDHWHFPMASEACQAGKDVYLEKPMTYTIDESAKLNGIVNETGRILQVGGSGPSTQLYWRINDYIRSGRMGKVLWGLISYNRNTDTGMWDYPIPGVGGQHWPDAEVSGENLDWDMWLGPAPKRPFSAERYFRWRKYWDYSGGNATDLLYHRLGAMSSMLGFDFPTRVTGAGGIYVQKNREVPDTYMTLVEYPGQYSINMVSCMANSQSVPLTVYGNWGTLEVLRGPVQAGDDMGDQTRGPQQRQRQREYALVKAQRQFEEAFKEANGGKTEVTIEQPEDDQHLVDNWLDCMRSRQKPVYDVLRGYQVMVAIKLGVDSYREGKVMAFDPATRRILEQPPARAAYMPAGA